MTYGSPRRHELCVAWFERPVSAAFQRPPTPRRTLKSAVAGFGDQFANREYPSATSIHASSTFSGRRLADELATLAALARANECAQIEVRTFEKVQSSLEAHARVESR